MTAKNKSLKVWKCKDGRISYPLPNCKVCGKRSNTTDKETAQIAKRIGRICHACTKKGNFNLGKPKIKPIDKDVERLMFPKPPKQYRNIWQRIAELFK